MKHFASNRAQYPRGSFHEVPGSRGKSDKSLESMGIAMKSVSQSASVNLSKDNPDSARDEFAMHVIGKEGTEENRRLTGS